MKLKDLLIIRKRYIAKIAKLRKAQARHEHSGSWDLVTALSIETQINDTVRMIKRYSTMIRQRCTV